MHPGQLEVEGAAAVRPHCVSVAYSVLGQLPGKSDVQGHREADFQNTGFTDTSGRI